MRPKVVATDAINLGRSDEGQKANDVGPDEVEDDNDGQGKDAQADGAIGWLHEILS